MEYILNKDKDILDEIIKYFNSSKKVYLAISYITYGGMQRLKKQIESLDHNSKLLTTTDGYVTDPQSLKMLLNSKAESRIWLPHSQKGFHVKTFLFFNNKKKTVITGSSNISHTAFFNNYEMESIADYDLNKNLSAENIFNELWNESTPLTKQLINKYEKEYNKRLKLRAQAFDLLKEFETEIIPNEMQVDALKTLQQIRDTKQNKALIIASTGTGKTYLSAFDVKKFNPRKMLFVVHNRIIIKDAIIQFKKIFHGEKKIVELNSNNMFRIDKYDFIFTTPNMVNNYLIDLLDKNYFDYIIIDEAHRSAAELHKNIFEYFNPKFLLGMTATPERTDGIDIYSFFDNNIAMDIRLNESLDKNLIAPFNYFAVESDVIDNNNKIRINKNNSLEVAKNIKNEIDQKGYYGQKLKALVFVYKIEEANLLADSFNDLGIDAEAIHSKKNKENQFELIEELQDDSQDLKILITVNKFNEGVDIPQVNTIIMTRYTESSIIFLQQLGRGLRKIHDPNKFLTILDFVGNYESNFEIIKAISGIETNDRSRLMVEIEKDFPSSSKYITIDLSYKSKARIMSSIKKIKGRRKVAITNTIVEQYKYLGKIPTLVQVEDKGLVKIEDLLQINNSLLEALNYKKEEFSEIEKDYVRYIQRFPIVTTSIEEKLEIIDLLKNGIHQFKKSRWTNYFIGELTTTINKSPKNYKNYFYKLENGNVVANKIPKGNLITKMVAITIEYLQYQVDLNISNYLQVKSKYKLEEILFMFDRVDLTSNWSGQIKLKNNDVIYLNNIEKENGYNNELLNLNKGIFSTQRNTKKEFIDQVLNDERKIYNFTRNRNFMKDDGNRFIFLGIMNDLKVKKYIELDNRYLFEYSLPYSLSAKEFEELNW